MTIDLQKTLPGSDRVARAHVGCLCQRRDSLQALLRLTLDDSKDIPILKLKRLTRILSLYDRLTIRLIQQVDALLEERNFSYFSMLDLEKILFSKSETHKKKGENTS